MYYFKWDKLLLMQLIFFIYFSFTLSSGFSQTIKPENIDSLLVLKKSGKISPEGLCKLYVNLYNKNFYKERAKSLKYNDSLYIVAHRHGLKTPIGEYLQNLSFISYLDSDYYAALRLCKKANQLFLIDKNYNAYLFSISRECMYLNALNKYEASLKLAKNTIKKFKKFTKFEGLGALYLTISEYYYYEHKLKNALIYAKIALTIFQNRKYYNGIAECDTFIALVYADLENYTEAIKIIKRLNDLPKEIRFNETYYLRYLLYMAEFHNKSHKYFEAIYYAKKAIEKFKITKLGYYIIEMQLCIADSYQKLGRNSESYKIIKFIERKIHDYASSEDIDPELKYINEIKSNIFYSQKKYDLALITIQKNLLFEEINIETFKKISKIQYKLAMYKEAFENLEIYNDRKIEQFKENQKNNINELQELYNNKDIEFKLQELKYIKAKNDLLLIKEKNFSNKVIIILTITLIGLILLFFSYRVKKKVGQILKHKNDKLIVINNLLIKSNKEKEVLLKEIHHRVKNNLQLISSVLYIQSNITPNVSLAEFLDECQSRISSIALIHQNLYMAEDLDKVEFQKYLEVLANSIINTFSEIGRVDIMIDAKETRLKIETAISLGLIISELICNSIKHAFKNTEKGKITIVIDNLTNIKYRLIIGDNGCNNDEKVNSSNSIGLELVNLLVMQLNGKITKLERDGTFFEIIFTEVSE